MSKLDSPTTNQGSINDIQDEVNNTGRVRSKWDPFSQELDLIRIMRAMNAHLSV
jgi:hypothetical protein